MSTTATSRFRYAHELWLGEVPSAFGTIEIVLDGTPERPDEKHLAAIDAFMLHAGESINRLRQRLPLSFLWRPIRFAPNSEGKVGVQFRHRLTGRMEMLFDDYAA